MSSTPLLRTERKRSLLLPTLAGGALVAIGALSSQRHSTPTSPAGMRTTWHTRRSPDTVNGNVASSDAASSSIVFKIMVTGGFSEGLHAPLF